MLVSPPSNEAPASEAQPAPDHAIVGGPTLALLITVLFVVGWVLPSALLNLVNPDEGRYTEISREMAATGDWLVPRLHGVPHWAKPPLTYWACGLSQRILGPTHLATRLPSVFASLLVIVTMALLGRRMSGPRVGWCAAIILASIGHFFAVGHSITTDMLTCLCTTSALAAWWAGYRAAPGSDAPSPHRFAWNLLAFLALGVGFLAKGPVSLALFFATIGAFGLLRRDFRLVPLGHLALGIALVLAIGLPWFFAVANRNPDLFDFFLLREVRDRYLTERHGRGKPFWFCTAVFLAGLAPWTPLFVATFWARVRSLGRALVSRMAPADVACEQFLLAWTLGPLVFFSFSGSQLWTYVLPVFPPAALLLARCVARFAGRPTEGADRHVRVAARITCGLAIVMAIAPTIFMTAWMHRDWARGASCLAPGALCAVAWWRIGRRSRSAASRLWLHASAVLAFIAYAAFAAQLPLVEDGLGDRASFAWVRDHLPPDICGAKIPLTLHPDDNPMEFPAGRPRLVTWRITRNSLSFYTLGLKPEVVRSFGQDTIYELRKDKDADKPPGLVELRRAISLPGDTYAVVPRAYVQDLTSAGLSIEPIASRGEGKHEIALVRLGTQPR